MAILAEKDNPPTCNLNCPILESEGTWWIAKVKPRQEKAFAFDLIEQCIGYYLPYYIKISKRSDGKNRKALLVLFPSYVTFISDDPYPLLKTNRLATILPVQAQTRFKQQLNQVYVANEYGIQVDPVITSNYQKGDFVKVVTGPLKGISGQIIRLNNESLLVIQVVGMGVACVNVNNYQVEPNCGD